MKELKSNPIIAALARDERAIPMSGFVGKSENGKLGIHAGFDSATYVEVDAKDIVHVIEAERDDQPTRFWVRETADIRIVSTLKALDIGRVNKPSILGECDEKSYDAYVDCLNRGGDLEWCRILSILTQTICDFTRRFPAPLPPTPE